MKSVKEATVSGAKWTAIERNKVIFTFPTTEMHK